MRDAHRAAFVANAAARGLPDPAKFAALAAGKQWRWPTSQPTTWEPRHMRSGQPLLPLSPVRQSQPASGSEKDSHGGSRLVLDDQQRRSAICWNVFDD